MCVSECDESLLMRMSVRDWQKNKTERKSKGHKQVEWRKRSEWHTRKGTCEVKFQTQIRKVRCECVLLCWLLVREWMESSRGSKDGSDASSQGG